MLQYFITTRKGMNSLCEKYPYCVYDKEVSIVGNTAYRC